MHNVAIIPARGGSKRIHKKNIKLFNGKPILAYAVKGALRSGLFEEVMVSTDDEEIAETAVKYGAKVPFMRSKETSNDYAILSDVIEEVKYKYLQEGISFTAICCILPTSPLLTPDNLRGCYELFINKNADLVYAIVKFEHSIQKAMRMVDGKIEMFNPDLDCFTSYDFENTYHDAGQFYWMKYETAFKGKNWYGFNMPNQYVQDIDTEQDWKIAELKMQLIQ